MSAAVPTTSPCVNVCIMDAASGYCRGCLRTLDEIGSWLHYTPAQRDAVMRALDARRAAAEHERAHRPPKKEAT